ncbi:MAG: recombinase family protein [Paracoccus sp. (in: a-proteobacteria)]
MKTDYFGYVRVSTQKQGEGASLEAQRDAIERYAAHNSLTITDWYCEKETAAKAGRPVFARMVKDMKKRRATGFIVHKIDRSARNFKDWAMIGDLSDAGFDIRFATETLEYNSRGGRLAADIQAVIAADYIRNLREETKKGLEGRLKQGLYPFKAPLGYRDNGGGKLKTICPRKGPLVRELFERYATGQYSIDTLNAEMFRKGLTNEQGRQIHRSRIAKILADPFYCGVIKIKRSGQTYPGNHEPLISTALFQRVQEAKAGHVRRATGRHRYLYRGLFKCQHCGYAMIGERQKGLIYYRCHTAGCPVTSWREERVCASVLDQLHQLELSPEAADRLQTEAQTWIVEGPDTAPMNIAKQIADIDAKLEKLTDAVIDGLIDRDSFNKRKETLFLERTAFEARLAEGGENRDAARTLSEFLEQAKSLAGLYETLADDEKREFLEVATSNRKLDREKLYVEPRNWLSRVGCGEVVAYGVQPPQQPRRQHEPAFDIEQVLQAIQTDEARRFIALCRQARMRVGDKKDINNDQQEPSLEYQ